MKRARQRKTHQTSILDFAKPGIRALDSYSAVHRGDSAEDAQLQMALAASIGAQSEQQQRILDSLAQENRGHDRLRSTAAVHRTKALLSAAAKPSSSALVHGKSCSSSSARSELTHAKSPLKSAASKPLSMAAMYNKARSSSSSMPPLQSIHASNNSPTRDILSLLPPLAPTRQKQTTAPLKKLPLQFAALHHLTNPAACADPPRPVYAPASSRVSPANQHIVLVDDTPPPTGSMRTPVKQQRIWEDEEESSPEVLLLKKPRRLGELRPAARKQDREPPRPAAPAPPSLHPSPDSITATLPNTILDRLASTLTSAKKPTPPHRRDPFSYTFLENDDDDASPTNLADLEHLLASPAPRSRPLAPAAPVSDASSPILLLSARRVVPPSQNQPQQEPILIDSEDDVAPADAGIACPLCTAHFPAHRIETHAAACSGAGPAPPPRACVRKESVARYIGETGRRYLHDAIQDFGGPEEAEFWDNAGGAPGEKEEEHPDYSDVEARGEHENRREEEEEEDDEEGAGGSAPSSPLRGFVNLNDLQQRGELGSLAGYFKQFDAAPKKRGGRSASQDENDEDDVFGRASQRRSSESQHRGGARGGRKGGGKFGGGSQKWGKGGKGGRGQRSGSSKGRQRGAAAATGGRRSSNAGTGSRGGGSRAADAGSHNYYADGPDFGGLGGGAGEMRWESGWGINL
ncbi:hypothetical protein BC830DRAFT_1120046 [Chytriomyces sp. MP71]|nr:hypothetical protein BC830DRAFT_1120046 [Chytriomyces sp. MP71]